MAAQSCAIPIFAVECGYLSFTHFFLSNLCEYYHKTYIGKNEILWATFPSQTVWV